MKITPMFSTQNAAPAPVEGASAAASLRSIRMTTNHTPEGREAPPADDELSTPDPSEAAKAADEATQPLSPQFAALAKQRRALQVKERELQEREKALSGQTPAQGGGIDLARLKSEPLSVLLEAGVSYDQLTEAILANQGNPELSELRAEIKALKEGVDHKFTENATQQEKQVLAEMQREATKLAAAGDTYELVRETRSIPQVMTLIERTYRETGEVLDVSEALQLVEDELIQESLKLAKLQKVQSRITPPPAPQPPQQQRHMRTLTNRDTASVPMSAKARALAAFHGTLKK